MQLVVNDLSVKFPCPDIGIANKVMEHFIRTYYLVKNAVDNDSILLDKDYRTFELAKNYRLEHWLNDGRIDIELKRRFRRMLNRSYTFDSEQFEKEYEWKLEAEFHHGQMISKSCQLAYEIQGVLISFLSEDCWKDAIVKGIYTYLEDTGELYAVQAAIPNVSCKENAALFCDEQEKKIAMQNRKAIRSGYDIYLCREKTFPNLIFCENALKQLQTEIGGTEAGQVYRRLLELQEAAKAMEGKFDRSKLTHASPETQITLQTFEEEHTIKLPNGDKILFSWHVRFTGGYGGRIFFEAIPRESKMYIGHIGKKLPTMKYH